MLHFIQEYLRLTERAESPTSYLWWGAISCISATLRDNVWFSFPERATRLYPNMYIFIIGDSAVTRKSTPFDINLSLLRGDNGVNNTKVMGGAATIQGVLKVLASTESGKPKGGSGYICAKEATGFFIDDPQTIPNLTNLYDFNPYFDKEIASYEIAPIKNVCLSIFAGTNEALMKRLLDQSAKEGGLLGRAIVLLESKRRQKSSGFEENLLKVTDEDWNKLRVFLKKLSTVQGPAILTPQARKRMDDWYQAYDFEEFHTKTGFEARLQAHVLKLATILSAAKEGFNLNIELSELDEAIQICSDLLPVYKKLTLGAGISPHAEHQVIIINALLNAKNHHLGRREILFSFGGDVNGELLDKIMDDLHAAGSITFESKGDGSTGYRLTVKFLNQFQMRMKQQQRNNGNKP